MSRPRATRWWHGNSEIRRFRAFPAMIMVVLLIPLFYGGMFLWSMWNPTENVDNMAVAVVNEDTGAKTSDGEQLQAGQKIVDNLRENDKVDWQFVSAQEAADGLRDGRFFVSVTIPKDFSAAVTSIGSKEPRAGTLEVHYNDATGSTAKAIVETIINNLHSSVATSIGAQAADKVFVSIDQIAQGVGDAANGSNRVNDGAQQLNTSVRDELAPGATKLSDSVRDELGPGAAKLADGVNNQLLPGVTTLRDSVRDQLGPGAAQLADGNRRLADGVQQLQDKIAPLRENPLAMQIPQVKELVDGVEKLNDGAGQARDGANQLSNGINTDLLNGTNELEKSVREQLAPGAQDLSNGINNQLVPGVQKLSDGINGKLLDGTGRLAEGTQQLSTGLGDAREKIPQYSAQQAKDNGEVVADPVSVKKDWLHRQVNNGEGMVPYFAALALFIGGIFTWQALRPLSRRALSASLSAFRAMIHSLAPGLLLATVQVVLLVGIAIVLFGLSADRWVPAFFLLLLAGWAFTSIQQTFAIWVGPAPGRLLSIIFLLVNLASAGGTYPLETLPTGLRAIGPALPFYHVVQGLREALIGSVGSGYGTTIAYLSAMLAVSMAVAIFGAAKRKVFTMRELHPAIPVA
ncbi:YhgE/Pip family protein [Corynebacterium urogenitale]